MPKQWKERKLIRIHATDADQIDAMWETYKQWTLVTSYAAGVNTTTLVFIFER